MSGSLPTILFTTFLRPSWRESPWCKGCSTGDDCRTTPNPIVRECGKLVYLYTKKKGSIPSCGDCKRKLFGIQPARPKQLMSMSQTKKHVTRTYGGSRCGTCVRQRIVRAFLIEEQKIVVRVLKAQAIKKKAH
ncbi:large ribosomal subunit protein eL34-like isoform X1 [Ptychodera flava]|uniref:large ribosomal subunit protein eL34-like isoform X1 n=1 Tax=Ptychodera flava TaxID=63121 RepID=UPI00396A3D15